MSTSTLEIVECVRKPLYVSCVRVTAENIHELAKWCSGDIRYTQKDDGSSKPVGSIYIRVRVVHPRTPRQTMGFIGDWILYSSSGYKVYTNKAYCETFLVVKDEVVETEDGHPVILHNVQSPKVREGVPHAVFVEVHPVTA